MGLLEKRDQLVAEYCGDKVLAMGEVREHFAHHKLCKPLGHLKKPCEDCAVADGMYLPVAALLSLLPADEVQFHSERWFCHNHGNCACRGNFNFQRKVSALME